MALGVHRVLSSSPSSSPARIWRMCDIDPVCRQMAVLHFGGICDDVCDDVRSLRGDPAAGVGLVYGGFPCQDVSTAGKRAGVVDGERSSLFREVIRLGVECRAAYIYLENVAALEHNGLPEVKRCLAEAGWGEIRWVVCSADLVGGRHRRRRIFILAHNRSFRSPASRALTICPNATSTTIPDEPPDLSRIQPKIRADKPWVNAIRMLGNSCVPQQAELALRHLLKTPVAASKPRAGAAISWDAAWDCPAAATDWPLPGTRRPFCELAPTLIASDCLGGRNARRREDGTYASMTLARWVLHNPEHGTWGTTQRRVDPIVPEAVVSVEWATWFMGFPGRWLALLNQ